MKKKKPIVKPKKKPTVSKLIKKLDAVFSIYIRKKYADEFGIGSCFTCGLKKPIQELQNGHYVSRVHKSLRYDEKNNHPQCLGCNIFKAGAMDEYALALQRKYGTGILEELNRRKREIKRFTVKELEDLIEHYQKA